MPNDIGYGYETPKKKVPLQSSWDWGQLGCPHCRSADVDRPLANIWRCNECGEAASCPTGALTPLERAVVVAASIGFVLAALFLGFGK